MSDQSGILDDVVGNGDSSDKHSPKKQSERVRQRRRDSYNERSATTVTSFSGMKKLKVSNNLVGKRRYPSLALEQQQQRQGNGGAGAGDDDDGDSATRSTKSELEMAVLTDCLSNHFLLTGRSTTGNEVHKNNCDGSDESFVMMETLVNRFEKVNFRKNELIFGVGDPASHLYVLYRGEVTTVHDDSTDVATTVNSSHHINNGIDENKTDNDGDEEKYTILGELELMTNSKYYSKKVKAISSCTLFRLSANNFRSYFLPQHQLNSSSSQQQPLEVREREEEDRFFDLLRKSLPEELSSFFFQGNDNDNAYHFQLLKDLLKTRKIRKFRKGDILIHKSKPLHALVIITDGLVIASDHEKGRREYENLRIGEGESRTSFGWQSVLKMTNRIKTNARSTAATPETGRIMTGTVRAETDGQAIIISKKSFENVFCSLCYNHCGDHQYQHLNGQHLLLDVQQLFDLRWKRTQLQQIMIFKDSALDDTQVDGLLDLMHHCEYKKEEVIFKVGDNVDAAMYFVREGSVRLEIDKGKEVRIIEKGGYFGEKSMLLDQNTNGNKSCSKWSSMTATSSSDFTKIDMLLLEECRNIINTTILGLGRRATINAIDDSVSWTDLKRHKLIGTGSYGQVWLASATKSTNGRIDDDEGSMHKTSRRVFAMKVQAKYPLIQADIAERFVAERNIMASMKSPFIMRLFNSFQDNYRLYMVTSLLPGGELESILPERGLSENSARFYAAGILEALTYMHRKHLIHRDVKTENIMLDSNGYPVLIDMGFGMYNVYLHLSFYMIFQL